MKARKLRLILLAAAVVGVAAGSGLLLGRSHSAAETTVTELARETHFHGIAVDVANPSRLLLATHHGLFAVTAEGIATRISKSRDDFMGFTPHPSDPATLYASGHPASGGNLGFVRSSDGGQTWEQLAKGVGGPVDFHQMDVSKADPSVIYGAYGGLQVSRDGGRSWEMIGPPPEGLIALAASAQAADTLYAATQRGLLISRDGGRSWQPGHMLQRPATMVHVTPAGELFAFLVGTGLVRAAEPELRWRTIGDAFGGAYFLHFAVDPSDAERWYAVSLDPETHAPAVLTTADGGASWTPLGAE